MADAPSARSSRPGPAAGWRAFRTGRTGRPGGHGPPPSRRGRTAGTACPGRFVVADAVDDLLAFFQQHVLHQRGLGLVVRGVDAHGLGNDDVLALAQQAAPQFQVHAIAHALLKQSVLFQQVAPEDGGLVRNGRLHHGQRAPVDRGVVDLAEDAVVGVGHEQVAADDRRPAARRRRAQLAQRAREVQVVRVLPAHVFAGGALEALVDGMRLAPVRLAFPMGQIAFVLADDVTLPSVEPPSMMMYSSLGYP